MKKVLSVLLAAVMIIACVPFVFAEEITEINYYEDYTFTADDALLSGYSYTVNPGVTLTVPVGLTLYVPQNGSLTVAQGGTLVVDGSLTVQPNGRLTIDGKLEGAANVDGAGIKEVQIRFPSLAAAGWNDEDVEIAWGYSASGNANYNQTSDFTMYDVPAEGAAVYCPLNTYLYIRADIVRDGSVSEKKYDDSLFKVLFNDHEMPIRAEKIHYLKAPSSGTITYSRWTNEDDFLKTYKVVLPSGKGYTVVGADGEYDEANVKYGQPFTFKIEYDEDYTMAATTADVYVYNGYGIVSYDENTPAEGMPPLRPDAAGNYTIPFVSDNYTIEVSMLSLDNGTAQKLSGVLQTVRSIFEMIFNFFRQVANVFKMG